MNSECTGAAAKHKCVATHLEVPLAPRRRGCRVGKMCVGGRGAFRKVRPEHSKLRNLSRKIKVFTFRHENCILGACSSPGTDQSRRDAEVKHTYIRGKGCRVLLLFAIGSVSSVGHLHRCTFLAQLRLGLEDRYRFCVGDDEGPVCMGELDGRLLHLEP